MCGVGVVCGGESDWGIRERGGSALVGNCAMGMQGLGLVLAGFFKPLKQHKQ